ncbi:hypothetical protein ACOSP7_022959 [Xanthoceras sorbifolium]
MSIPILIASQEKMALLLLDKWQDDNRYSCNMTNTSNCRNLARQEELIGLQLLNSKDTPRLLLMKCPCGCTKLVTVRNLEQTEFNNVMFVRCSAIACGQSGLQ